MSAPSTGTMSRQSPGVESFMACSTRKFGWTNKAEAKRWLRRFRSRGGCDVKSLYRCTECGGWHMTHYRRVLP